MHIGHQVNGNRFAVRACDNHTRTISGPVGSLVVDVLAGWTKHPGLFVVQCINALLEDERIAG